MTIFENVWKYVENVEDNIEDNEEGFSEDEILKNDIERDRKTNRIFGKFLFGHSAK